MLSRELDSEEDHKAVQYLVSLTDPKAGAKWRKQATVQDRETGPRDPRSTATRARRKRWLWATRRHALLASEDGFHAVQPSLPPLTHPALHRCRQRQKMPHLPDVDDDRQVRQRVKRCPIGCLHVVSPKCRPPRSSRISWQVTVPASSPLSGRPAEWLQPGSCATWLPQLPAGSGRG